MLSGPSPDLQGQLLFRAIDLQAAICELLEDFYRLRHLSERLLESFGRYSATCGAGPMSRALEDHLSRRHDVEYDNVYAAALAPQPEKVVSIPRRVTKGSFDQHIPALAERGESRDLGDVTGFFLSQFSRPYSALLAVRGELWQCHPNVIGIDPYEIAQWQLTLRYQTTDRLALPNSHGAGCEYDPGTTRMSVVFHLFARRMDSLGHLANNIILKLLPRLFVVAMEGIIQRRADICVHPMKGHAIRPVNALC
mmetsp:Transcript_12776/g.37585  ORF Transcript_12776/g.37585 Transcript_12776/m.37585 type:complete len:252 (+) Transcript_12776:283-1038(+)